MSRFVFKQFTYGPNREEAKANKALLTGAQTLEKDKKYSYSTTQSQHTHFGPSGIVSNQPEFTRFFNNNRRKSDRDSNRGPSRSTSCYLETIGPRTSKTGSSTNGGLVWVYLGGGSGGDYAYSHAPPVAVTTVPDICAMHCVFVLMHARYVDALTYCVICSSFF